ncbi:hypothetical protein KY290_005795 [Solanum tuberosum]|uniref:DOG1 domain-containing protein n=1 Tax=Solanum tuberosum TaxID=4113 RepID=A0ABQ7WH09_SOLTU|nr:hypothetical protein KY284_005838 [Solanum tuberosum]KAH0723100.1 hypothetical protein KY289_006144 [Solanum tuberosum]KAH0752545.1 hypothetical protein KY285_005693 [Solanum tuberosum]KAH0779368.1 hypothetical protein KY290_005795 [Solanum tuberosum]
MAFKQTSRRFKHVDVSSSSASAPPPKWKQEMTSMKSQLNALLSLYQKNIGNVPSLISTSSTGCDDIELIELIGFWSARTKSCYGSLPDFVTYLSLVDYSTENNSLRI